MRGRSWPWCSGREAINICRQEKAAEGWYFTDYRGFPGTHGIYPLEDRGCICVTHAIYSPGCYWGLFLLPCHLYHPTDIWESMRKALLHCSQKTQAPGSAHEEFRISRKNVLYLLFWAPGSGIRFLQKSQNNFVFQIQDLNFKAPDTNAVNAPLLNWCKIFLNWYLCTNHNMHINNLNWDQHHGTTG